MLNKLFALFLAAALGAIAWGCNPNQLAGGGTDTETALVAGRILSGGSPVQGATVIIDGDNSLSDVTGSDGTFSIKDVEYGSRDLYAEWEGPDGTYAVSTTISVNEDPEEIGDLTVVKVPVTVKRKR